MLKPPTDKISAETREKLLALAEFIDIDQKHGFYMGVVLIGSGDLDVVHRSDRPECGTAGCIAGHCLVQHKIPYSGFGGMEMASEVLGLSEEQKKDLFMPAGLLSCNDRAKAVRVLRNFAYTGDVDWSV